LRKFLPFIVAQTSVSSKPLSLLIDSGASISILQEKSLDKMPQLENIIVTFTGLGNTTNPMKSLGTIPVKFNDLNHKFHVAADLDFPYDGIVGNDFLSNSQSKIDFKNNVLIVNKIKIPLEFTEPIYTIAPRTETVIECSVQNPEIKEGLILDQHPIDSLLIANCIVQVKPNSRINITVVNTSEEKLIINSNLKLKIVPLEKRGAQIFHTSHSSDDHTDKVLERTNKVLDLLRVSHLNAEEMTALYELCCTFSDIFHLPTDRLTSTNILQHEIPTTSSVPIHTKSYRFPEVHKQEVQSQISKMLDDGIIKPSTSPWSSPIWIVPKKIDASGQRKWRIVIDYRRLNDITIGDSYPIPNIAEILDQLGKSKYFSTLDLASGFHQIKMAEQDAPKTAFSVPQGHFEFTRMPFGLKNAPSTFQRLMNSALSGLQGIQCFVYLDDIVTYSFDLESHIKNLSNIFDRLRHFNLKLQPDKCEFLRKEVSYLGHIITDDGVRPNPEKIKAVQEFPQPQCPKDIKSFLGLVSYYRRFIKDISKISKPLTNLLKKDTLFKWENEQQLAFERLKACLTSAPLLSYPDFSIPFVLTCDASNYAISAILSQGPVGSDKPIAFASRTLTKAECNYSTTEKECVAILFGTKTFRPYLYGRHFKIITDHRPLKWLFNHKDPGSKLVRWRLKLEEFDYEVEYKKGKINSNADALSRYPVNPVLPPIDLPDDDQTSGAAPSGVNPQSENNGNQNQLTSDDDFSPLTLEDLDIRLPSSPLDIDSNDLPSIDLLDNDDVPPEVQDTENMMPDIPNLQNDSPIPSTSPSEPLTQTNHNSNQDYNDFLKAFLNRTETFNTQITEFNESLLKTKSKTILIPVSIDFDDSNPYLQDLLSNLGDTSDLQNSERELHSFKKLEANEKVYYFLFIKVYHFDNCSYPEIFKTLKAARDDIILTGEINEIAIHDFKNPFQQHSYIKIYGMLMYLFNNTNISVNIYHNILIYPALSEINKILKENHDIPIAGHLGNNRMYNRIKERYYWKNMRSDVENYIKKCPPCQRNKALRKTNRAPMQITSTSTAAFERVSLDIVGPLPESGQAKLKYILTLQDDLTKYSVSYPTRSVTAEETSECLLHFISLFGIPKTILTDQGTNFTAELFKQTCSFLKIKQLWSSPYHPQTQGALERSHSTLKEYLKSYVSENQDDWPKYVYTAMLAYNTAIHTTTNYSPYELVFGHKPHIPNSVYESALDATYPDYVKMLQHRLQHSRNKAIENIMKSKESSKNYYDSRTRPVKYKVGDFVWLKNHLRLRRALAPIWKGPYKVIKINGRNTLTLLINRRHVTHHYDEVKLANRAGTETDRLGINIE
jgi:transposase InsO family protein